MFVSSIIFSVTIVFSEKYMNEYLNVIYYCNSTKLRDEMYLHCKNLDVSKVEFYYVKSVLYEIAVFKISKICNLYYLNFL